MTYSEFLQFVRNHSIPTSRGECYNGSMFESISEALQFHGYVTRDFKVDDSVTLLSSHDVYFISFYLEDKNYAMAMN